MLSNSAPFVSNIFLITLKVPILIALMGDLSWWPRQFINSIGG